MKGKLFFSDKAELNEGDPAMMDEDVLVQEEMLRSRLLSIKRVSIPSYICLC